jgi:hypothetical protein
LQAAGDPAILASSILKKIEVPMRFLLFCAIVLFNNTLSAATFPVLFGIQKLDSTCQGQLAPLLQTLAISQNGLLLGTQGKASIIRFDNLKDAVASRGRENNCVRLGRYIHTADTKTKTISYETKGKFEGALCIGTCPGLKFVSHDKDIFWVDPVSIMDLLGYTNVLKKKWEMKGLFRFERVFAENPNTPKRYKEILYLKSIRVIP